MLFHISSFVTRALNYPLKKWSGMCLLLGHVVVQLVEACATSCKTTGLIPDGVTGIFH